MKNRRKNNKKLMLLALLLAVTVGFALLSTTLKINGTAGIKGNTWDIHWENVVPNGQSTVTTETPVIGDNGTSVTYEVNLELPGDFYEFTVDAVNDGSVNGKIDDIRHIVKQVTIVNEEEVETTATLPNYILYSVVYDGTTTEPAIGDILEAGDTKTYKVRIEYDPLAEVLPSSDLTFRITDEFDYEQTKDSNSNVHPDNIDMTNLSSTKCTENENITLSTGTICKRAINLHQEECNSSCIAVGYTPTGSKGTSTVTYGNCGTQGNAPVSGDAFTCDVNGDGKFDELTERFYYINDYFNTSTKTFDSSTAVLVYYNNVIKGISCNSNTSAYSTVADIQLNDPSRLSYNQNDNWHGPLTIVRQLPTTTQWSNVNLKNSTRAILSEYQLTHNSQTTTGGTLPTDFSYSGYAARLLAAQELMSGCNVSVMGNIAENYSTAVGELDSCNYLLENTGYTNSSMSNYGYWLETPNYSSYYNAFSVHGSGRLINIITTDNENSIGARPVIEVPKNKMSY